MKVTQHRCDNCHAVVDYQDADSDRHVRGFVSDGGVVEVKVHVRQQYGSGGYDVPSFHFEHICSPFCLRQWVEKWMAAAVDNPMWKNAYKD